MASEFPDFDSSQAPLLAELGAKELKALLTGLFESSLDGIAILRAVRNEDTEIVAFDWVLANSIAAAAVHKTTDTISGERVSSSFPGLPSLFKDYCQVVESGQALHKDIGDSIQNRKVHLDLNAAKYDDGLVVTFRDITEVTELRAQFKAQENIDGLTGVMNRRAFDATLDREWRHCLRVKKPLSLILCDLDYFRRYNDRSGPQRGDDCLKQVAKLLGESALRPRDFVARYGGEEFILVLAETPSEGAQTVAEAFQRKLAELKLSHSSSPLGDHLTASLGIVTMTPSQEASPSQLIDSAEACLIKAKENGRDRIEAETINS
ncbi:MAG: GGDEF domain-containing protein [Planctomycetota bacterium]|nr:GGDEF domain-containing protein [Planctomycetota bacterium]